jgi:methylthioribulose-1-phosphate dehydratase
MNQQTQTNQLNPYAIQLCTLGRWIAKRQWVAAGSGCFSIRTGEHNALFAASGKDKNELSPADLISVQLQNEQADAVVALHSALYQLSPETKVVLHTHSVQATVFSRLIKADQHIFVGYQLQEAIAEQSSQHSYCPLPLLEHQQDVRLMIQELQQRLKRQSLPYAFLVRGHGLYVWGDCLDSAKRHLEAWQFLIACELERIKATSLFS